MFTKKNSRDYRFQMAGVRMRPLVFEEKSLMCEFLLEGGHKLPAHHHPYEQSGYLLSGRLRFRIGEEWHETQPGDSWCIPEGVVHEVEVLEEAHLVEIFIPIRPDYLPDPSERRAGPLHQTDNR